MLWATWQKEDADARHILAGPRWRLVKGEIHQPQLQNISLMSQQGEPIRPCLLTGSELRDGIARPMAVRPMSSVV